MKRNLILEKVDIEKLVDELLILEDDEELKRLVKYQMIQFLVDKKNSEIILELKHILYNKEWCGECPNPLGQTYNDKLLMQHYIPKDFKKVCEKYLVDHWERLNEGQRNILTKWISQ